MKFPGGRLKRRREQLGLSLDQVAGMIGKTKAYVWLLESGERANPSYDVLELLCRSLKVPGGFFSVEQPTPLPPESVSLVIDAPPAKLRGRPPKQPGSSPAKPKGRRLR